MPLHFDISNTFKLRKINFKSSLRFKLLTLITILLVTIVTPVLFLVIKSSSNDLHSSLQREAVTFANLATIPIGDTFINYKDSGTIYLNQKIDSFTVLENIVKNVTIVSNDGSIQYSRSASDDPKITPEQATSFDSKIFYGDKDRTLSRIIFPYFESYGAHRYSIVYDFDASQIESLVHDQTIKLLIYGTFALAIAIIAVYVMVSVFIVKPIYLLSDQAQRISLGDLSQEIAITGKDEISHLGQSINEMANSLKVNIKQLHEVDAIKSEFMIIASHNLRTPLTVINGYTDSREKFKSIEEYKAAFEGISTSAKRLNTFSEDILTISRFELGETKLRTEHLDLTSFIQDMSADFHLLCDQSKHEYTSTIDNRPRLVDISSANIRSAVWNIFDNAQKFTPEHGQISLRLDDDGIYANITISDSGIGIKEEELPKLFTKFHRGTDLLQYDYEGTGIGLYASKLIIERHGGKILASSTEGKGSTFTINIPLSISKISKI